MTCQILQNIMYNSLFLPKKDVHKTIKWVPGNYFFFVAFSPMEPVEKKQY